MYLIFKTRTESNRNQRVRRQPIPQLLLTHRFGLGRYLQLLKNMRSAKARTYGSHGLYAQLKIKCIKKNFDK